MWNWLKKKPTPTPAEAAATRVGTMVAWWLLGFLNDPEQFARDPGVLNAAKKNYEKGLSDLYSVAVIAGVFVGDWILARDAIVRDAVRCYLDLPEIREEMISGKLSAVAMPIDTMAVHGLFEPKLLAGAWEMIYDRSHATELDPDARRLYESISHLGVRAEIAAATHPSDDELNGMCSRVIQECRYALQGDDKHTRAHKSIFEGWPVVADPSAFQDSESETESDTHMQNDQVQDFSNTVNSPPNESEVRGTEAFAAGRQAAQGFDSEFKTFTEDVVLWKESEYIVELKHRIESALNEPPEKRYYALNFVNNTFIEAVALLEKELRERVRVDLSEWFKFFLDCDLEFMGSTADLRIAEQMLKLRKEALVLVTKAVMRNSETV